MATLMELQGVILAGGLSRRMDGKEKSFLNLAGKPLIMHAINRLQAQCPNIVINANGDPERFRFTGLPTIEDNVPGFAGPLAGVLAGMDWAHNNTPERTHIITAATDTPFFPDDYVTRMVEKTGKDKDRIVLAASEGRRHPVFGLWPVALRDALRAFLVDENERKVMLFVERYQNSMVEFASGEYDPFFNINTADDLAKAKSILKERA